MRSYTFEHDSFCTTLLSVKTFVCSLLWSCVSMLLRCYVRLHFLQCLHLNILDCGHFNFSITSPIYLTCQILRVFVFQPEDIITVYQYILNKFCLLTIVNYITTKISLNIMDILLVPCVSTWGASLQVVLIRKCVCLVSCTWISDILTSVAVLLQHYSSVVCHVLSKCSAEINA